jgi:hypothetical protein
MRSTLAMLLLVSALPCPAAEPGAFRFLTDILRQDAGRESILAVTLDSDIFAATRDGLPDLRIFDGKDQEVPYLLEKATESRTQTVHERSASEVISLRERDNAIEVLVRLDRDSPPADGLTVHTPVMNYERRLRVFGSDDGKDWSALLDNGLIFDYSRFMDVRNGEVRLPKNRYRNLKITIFAITDSRESPFMELTRRLKDGAEQERIERSTLERRPLRIERLELWHEANREVSRQDKRADYPIVAFRTEEDPKGKATIVHIRTRRQPLTELTLETSNRNFSRAAVVEKPVTQGIRTDWAAVARNQIRLIDFRGLHSEDLTIAFPEHREEVYRIVIRNDDNPPLSISGVKARGNVYRTVFLAAPAEPYRVYYGSEQVQQPKYDMAAVLLPLRQGGDAVAATIGPQVPNPAAGPEASELTARRLWNNPLALGGLVVSMVALLGWVLFRATRRISQLPRDPETQ